MTATLDSVAISNFRSISGSVTVPLGAPIVLIQGSNGAGKTSILSAIELALTGDVPDMRRSDPTYQLHLLHRGTIDGQVILRSTGLSSASPTDVSSINVNIIAGGSDPRQLLNETEARFFSERCYLAQSTLGRLLEIYQYASPRHDSPLTRFVKDLLGLDQLDTLIDGLKLVGDVRNIRKLVPEYRQAEERRTELVAQRSVLEERLAAARARKAGLVAELRSNLAALQMPAGRVSALMQQTGSLEELLSVDTEEKELIEISRRRLRLVGLSEDWQALALGSEATERAEAEAEERDAAALAMGWRQTMGQDLENLLDKIRAIFPGVASSISTGPLLARAAAVALVDSEIRLCDQRVSQDDAISNRLGELEQTIARARARIGIIDERLSQVAGNSAQLSTILAALMPHIRGEECPVCGRDFSEVSAEPLVAHLSAQVARITEAAGTMQALTAEKATAAALLAQAEREHDETMPRRLSQDDRLTYKTRAAQLAEVHRKFIELAQPVDAGSAILRREAVARRRLAELRTRDKRGTEIRREFIELCGAMTQPPLGEAETIPEAIDRLEQHIVAEDARLTGMQRSRRKALGTWLQLNETDKSETITIDGVAALQSTLEALEIAFKVADQRRSAAKEIGAAAQDARTAIVRRVFNGSLNAIWHDLFIRLAPTEPFVPSFKLPESSDRTVMAVLETVHRAGGHGGAPGAMLSAGNLNTAALTLFLALHLSVRARLPWLLLDDPVQSMDEVHIAQFAALLRTLSKRHGRQIILAVHDRQLFEYLALELGPAFEGDRLITIELGRSPAGATIAEPSFRNWEPDPAVAAA